MDIDTDGGAPAAKAPLSAYMRFAADRRAGVAAANPGAFSREKNVAVEMRAPLTPHPTSADVGMAGRSKIVGALWAALPEEEKKALQARASEEKAAWVAAGGVRAGPGAPADADDSATRIPVARVKRLVKALSGDAARNVAKDAAFVLTAATELFLQHLASESVDACRAAGGARRTISALDILRAIANKPELAFLRADFPLPTPAAIAAARAARRARKGEAGVGSGAGADGAAGAGGAEVGGGSDGGGDGGGGGAGNGGGDAPKRPPPPQKGAILLALERQAAIAAALPPRPPRVESPRAARSADEDMGAGAEGGGERWGGGGAGALARARSKKKGGGRAVAAQQARRAHPRRRPPLSTASS
jgi:histone H3/H4